MKQADIKRLERVVKNLEKAYNDLCKLDDSLWKQPTEYFHGRTQTALIHDMQEGVWSEMKNAQYKLDAFTELMEPAE